MKLYTTIKSLQSSLEEERLKKLKIGFVPTMGALHNGHLSLVEQASIKCDIVVISIFVNPTQFNDPKDLLNYPRTLNADMELLSGCRCDYVFSPSVEEMYPDPDNRKFDFGTLENVMEGKFRPGHFNGVGQVVSKLFDIVKPDFAFFGRKDFQQLAVVNTLVRQLNYPVHIIPCDIIREDDGLAMSSRNKLLLPEHRQCAPMIFQTLLKAKEIARNKSVSFVRDFVIETINETRLLKIEYFEIVYEQTLESVGNWNEPGTKVGCIALFAGNVRLIDNIVFDI